MSKASDIQFGGDHYKTAINHWDWCVQLGYGYQYFTAAATKYITRHRKKNGLQDLQKALHYLDKLIEESREGRAALAPMVYGETAKMLRAYTDNFILANSLHGVEVELVRLLARPVLMSDLHQARHLLAALIEREYPPESRQPASKPEYTLVSMGHTYIAREGFQAEGWSKDVTHWQCLKCKAHISIPDNVDPKAAHECGEATPAYVGQL